MCGTGLAEQWNDIRRRDLMDKEQDKQQLDGSPSCADEEQPIADEGNASPDVSQLPTMSKNQMKKKRRLEKKMEIKKRRKQQEREARHAKAIAEGRDLDEERRQQAIRTAAGDSKRRKAAVWAERMEQANKNFQVAVDCAYDSQLTAKEINSLASQIRYCYAVNRRSSAPCFLAATSVAGLTLEHLQNEAGFAEWTSRAFTSTDKDLTAYYPKGRHADLIYLTRDAESVLDTLEADKIYIIGGIVDRNRLKKAALARAEELQISTARLPIDTYLQKMESTRVLTCNHVFGILMHYREHRDWEKALCSR